MPENDIAPSLEMDQDLGALRREWRFERVGRWLILLVVLATLAGALGDGPVARARLATPSGRDAVEYDRLLRFGTVSALRLTLAAASPDDTLASVSFDRDYLELVDVKSVLPEPLDARASGDQVVYRFRRAAAGGPIVIGFGMSATGVGRLRPVMQTASGRLALHQFVLP